MVLFAKVVCSGGGRSWRCCGGWRCGCSELLGGVDVTLPFPFELQGLRFGVVVKGAHAAAAVAAAIAAEFTEYYAVCNTNKDERHTVEVTVTGPLAYRLVQTVLHTLVSN